MTKAARNFFTSVASLRAVDSITKEPPHFDNALRTDTDRLAKAVEVAMVARFHQTAVGDAEKLEPLRTNEQIVALVRSLSKPSLGRTPDIKVQCDAEVAALAFTVHEGRAELVAVFRSGTVGALTGPHSISSYLEISCTCGGANVTVGTLYAAALRAIRDPRPGVSLHQIDRSG